MYKLSVLELPIPPAHRALLPRSVGRDPLHNAVHVKRVVAATPNHGTVLARHFAIRTAPVERQTADPAGLIVAGAVRPRRYGTPPHAVIRNGKGRTRLFALSYFVTNR